MKKTLVALAALAATSAFAQSSVTVYGIMDVAYKNYQVKNNYGDNLIKSNGIMDGTNAGNRLGFKGVEDLGNGRSANFVAEFGMTVADPAGLSNRAGAEGAQVNGVSNSGNIPLGAYGAGSNTRQAYVSLGDSKLGEVRAGYMYAELYNTSTNTGFFIGQEQPGGFLHKMSNAEFGGTRANGLAYVSPKLWNNTTTITVQHGAGTARETFESDYGSAPSAAGTIYSGQVGYTKNNLKRDSVGALFEQGPLRLGYAYTQVKQEQALGSALVSSAGAGTTTYSSTYNSYGVPTAQSATTVAYNYTSSLNQLNGSYDFGVIKPVVQYSKGKKTIDSITTYGGGAGTGAANSNGTVTSAVGGYDYKAYTLGATVPVGNATFFVLTGKGDVKSATATLFDYTEKQVGVRYALSKRTTAYVATGESKDKVAAATANSTASGKSTYSAIGMAHSF